MNGSSIDLIQNAALLVALAFVFDLTFKYIRVARFSVHQVAVGCVIGGLGILVMLTPWVHEPGIVFDTRSILLSVTGLFFGIVPTVIAMAITITMRVIIGGAGIWMGIGTILLSGGIGLLWGRWRKWPKESITWRELYLFGLMVHAAMISLTVLLPPEAASRTFSRIAIPIITIYPIGTMFLGLLLSNRSLRLQQQAKIAVDTSFLRLSEATAHVGYWMIDMASGRLTWSDEIWKIFGADPGSNGSDPRSIVSNALLPEEFQQEHTSDVFQGLKPGERVERRIQRPDRSIRVIEIVRGVDLLDDSGRSAAITGVVQDVTDRVAAEREARQAQAETARLLETANASRRALLSMMEDQRLAEQRLRESEERIRLAVTAANQGYFDLDLRTGSAIVSPEYATMIGYDPDTFVETNAAWLERLHPDDRPGVERAFREYVAGLRPDYRVEFRQRTADGKWKWIMSLGKVVERETDGTPRRMLGTHTDLDERKRMEEELRETSDKMRALANRLEFAREEERKQISRDIHDSLGQELTAIRMDLSFLSSGRTKEEIKEQLARTANVADRAIATVRRISRSLRPDVLDQLGLVEAIRWIASDFVAHNKIGCTVSASEDVPALPEGLTVALFRVVQESLTNVSKHARATEVVVDLSFVGHTLSLSITDNGKGVQPQDLAQRGRLGLVGMRERVRALGGECVVEAVPTGGTRVSVVVPLADHHPTGDEP